MFMNFGKPAPVPTNTASNPSLSRRSVSFLVRPTTKLVRISTPSPGASRSPLRRSSWAAGIPGCRRSEPARLVKRLEDRHRVPSRRTSAATVTLAGPLPTTATFRPVSGLTWALPRSPAAARRPPKRSRRPWTRPADVLQGLAHRTLGLALHFLRAHPAAHAATAAALDYVYGALTIPLRNGLDESGISIRTGHPPRTERSCTARIAMLQPRLPAPIAQRHLLNVAPARDRILRRHFLRRNLHPFPRPAASPASRSLRGASAPLFPVPGRWMTHRPASFFRISASR